MKDKIMKNRFCIIFLTLLLSFVLILPSFFIGNAKADDTQTEYVIPAGEYVLNETLLPYFGSDAPMPSEALIPFEFTSYNGSRDITFFGFYFQKLNTDWDFLRYADTVPLPDLPETVYDFSINSYLFYSYRSITLNTDAIIDNFTFYSWFAENSTFEIPVEPEPEPEQNKGALTYAYEFFYHWLWGDTVPTAFAPYADSITVFMALFFVSAMCWFAFKLVTGVIRLVYYLFEK